MTEPSSQARFELVLQVGTNVEPTARWPAAQPLDAAPNHEIYTPACRIHRHGVIPVVAGGSDSTGQNERRGCISWLSLTVPDALPSRDFYQRVVGWNARSIEMEDSEGHFGRFEMQRDNEIAAAEICQYRDDFRGIPSVWLIHLPVDDLVDSLRRVSEGGGEVIREYAEEKYAVVRDPVGAYLALRSG